MIKEYDVVIIGAGTAGLTALKEVRKLSSNFLIVDRGPLGTTCSRVGCMPSKVLLQLAHDYSAFKRLESKGVWKGAGSLNIPEVMRQVRSLRDHFVGFILKDIEELGDTFRQGHARFIGPNHLMIDDKYEVKAKAVIIATGGSPIIPKQWAAYSDKIVTTDSFFELENLADSWGVIGMGPIGLELGQAMALLERKVFGFGKEKKIAGLSDSVVMEAALKGLREDFPIHLGEEVKLSREGSQVVVHFGDRTQAVDQLLVAAGRKPNLEGLGLEQTGCPVNEKGLPVFDSQSMKVKGTAAPLFVAGDFDGEKAILHEAADDGRIAGYNALQKDPILFKRKTPLAVTFTIPNIASIGLKSHELPDAEVGEVSFHNQGRSKIIGENKGMLRIYAQRHTGNILGAELMAPSGEHLAHILAAAISEGLTVSAMLRHPFYHPTVEEGLRTALRDVSKKLDLKAPKGPDLERLNGP